MTRRFLFSLRSLTIEYSSTANQAINIVVQRGTVCPGCEVDMCEGCRTKVDRLLADDPEADFPEWDEL